MQLDEQEEEKEILKFKAELDKLEECQNSKSINSCFKCNDMLICETRNQYVVAVYESMNPNIKDDKTGFEF